jgi:hypothetical protein
VGARRRGERLLTNVDTRAGYKHPNRQGPRLLVNVGVAAAIRAGYGGRTARTIGHEKPEKT